MLDIQYTEEGLKELNYVVVDIKPKEGHDPNVKGFFLGIKTLTHENDDNKFTKELFIWVYKSKNVSILNLKRYFVSSIEICINNMMRRTQTTHFKKDESSASLAKLHTIQSALINQKRIKTNGLIDVSTYKFLPPYIINTIGEVTKNHISGSNTNITTSEKKTLFTQNKAHDWYNQPTTTYKPKEVETSMIKRTTKCSVEEALSTMKAKVEEIKKGTYQSPKLKKIPADCKKKDKKEDEKKVDTPPAQVQDEDYYLAGFAG